MMAGHWSQDVDSTARLRLLKVAACLWAVLASFSAYGQSSQPIGDPALRAELTQLLRAGAPEQAIRHAQAALQRAPASPGVRHEYITLHLALARDWLAARKYDACLTALEAVLAVDPRHESARALRREILTARAEAPQHADQVTDLLNLELFEAALERINELKALQPSLATALAPQERAAWLGAADDHYAARNFHEAFALYENVLALDPDAPADVHSRWALSLALALAEGDFSQPADPQGAGRLLARSVDVLVRTDEPITGLIVGGLLAERAGQLIDAGRTYAEALGQPWELPPADRRRDTIARLRAAAVDRARALYEATPTRRRAGSWAIALPDVWKRRQTAHFDVYARNDLVAARVARTLEFHFARLSEWLGVSAQESWDPRLEVRVHADRPELHAATGTQGITCAVSHTRLQGQRVLLRKLEVCQTDPWLLSATLPHELTHAIIADACRRGSPPLAVDEGLALQAEPPARRLMYRRRLPGSSPAPADLLAAQEAPADLEAFYAHCDALTAWLLERCGRQSGPEGATNVVPALLEALREGVAPDWWRSFGWQSAAAMQADWRAWLDARRNPPRMPLMILVEPTPKHPRGSAPNGDRAP